jgi:lauroyl/myristoyl acyltransferase
MDEAIPSAAPLPASEPAKPAGPSSLYRGNVWKLALAGARVLPLSLTIQTARILVHTYRLAQPRRSQIIFENLLPVFSGDETAAHAATIRLYTRFATKLADLLRFEAGLAIDSRFTELSYWENFERAHAKGAGVLMVTPHLGNWEIGSSLMIRKKIPFYAVTQPEPGGDFTKIRVAARARWGVETIVVGQDAFSFIEIIRRLQEGAAVAMLIDRPFGPSGVNIELFGKPYTASIATAELARASGCAVVGGTIVEDNGGYAARFMPELQYDRRALGSREGRRQFTQRIMSAFEPAIKQYADQWYQFVPVWPQT